MKATIREGHAPAVLISLDAGDRLVSEAGAMMFISGDVAMDVEMPGGLDGRPQASRSRARACSSPPTRRTARAPSASAGRSRARSASTSSTARSSARGTRTSATTATCEIESAFAQRLGMGVSGGGEGFFLQRLKGKGTVWLHGGGDFLDFDLVDGQTLSSTPAAW